MRMFGRVRSTVIAATALALAVGSCTPAPPSPRTDTFPNSTNSDLASFPWRQVESVLRGGYDAIASRYLEPVLMADIAMEGLNGLGTIDSALSFRREESKVAVMVSGKTVALFDAPADNDVLAWARLMTLAAASCREYSPAMAKVDPEDIYRVIFEATLAHLDGFSRYAGASKAEDNRAARNGYGGIGVYYRSVADGVEMTEISPASPAEDAGIAVGDVITGIDGKPVPGLSSHAVIERLRGPINSEVKLALRKKGSRESLDITLARALIVPETVTLVLKGNIAQIRIASFNQRTGVSVGKALRNAYASLGARLKGVVLDLRGNPGGLLDQGVAVSDLFLAGGAIISTRGRHPEANQGYTASSGDIGESAPLVVLMDGRSASAAEIVAAALQDNNRAVVIGSTSYGKGTVQTVVHLPNDGELTLTWSRFHSPSGYALHKLGVLPSVCTSDVTDSPTSVIADVRAGQEQTASALARWRAIPVDDIKGREALRKSCPPVRHETSPIEGEVARRLLNDQALYAQALSLLPQVAESH